MTAITSPPLLDLDASLANRWDWQPNPLALREEATRLSSHVRPAHLDPARTTLLLVDMQRDFCLPEGALFVAGQSGRGAVDDTARLCSFAARNLEQITDITCTLDTHQPVHIFFAGFWQKRDGEPVAAGRVVSAADVESGDLVPRPELATPLLGVGASAEDLRREALEYCRALESQGRYQLFLWPEHCLLGSDGHALVGLVQQVRLFHAWARRTTAPLLSKGMAPLTEHYSALGPEVRTAGRRSHRSAEEHAVIDRLLTNDRLLIAGQASSHCVLASVDDLIAEALQRDASLVARIHVLTDCMSPVVLRDDAGNVVADFSAQADEAFERWRTAGVQLVRSTDELPEL